MSFMLASNTQESEAPGKNCQELTKDGKKKCIDPRKPCCHLYSDRECPHTVGDKISFTCPEGYFKTFWTCTTSDASKQKEKKYYCFECAHHSISNDMRYLEDVYQRRPDAAPGDNEFTNWKPGEDQTRKHQVSLCSGYPRRDNGATWLTDNFRPGLLAAQDKITQQFGGRGHALFACSIMISEDPEEPVS
jgi:hypothetical protein